MFQMLGVFAKFELDHPRADAVLFDSGP
jgi:hypothetical protein